MYDSFFSFFFALTDANFFEDFNFIDLFSSSVLLYLPFISLLGLFLFSLVFLIIRWIRGS